MDEIRSEEHGPAQPVEQPPQPAPPVPPQQDDTFAKTALQLAITVALAVGVFYILQFLLAALGIGGA